MQIYFLKVQNETGIYSALGGLQVGCQTHSIQLTQARVVGSNIPSVVHRTRVGAVFAVEHSQ